MKRMHLSSLSLLQRYLMLLVAFSVFLTGSPSIVKAAEDEEPGIYHMDYSDVNIYAEAEDYYDYVKYNNPTTDSVGYIYGSDNLFQFSSSLLYSQKAKAINYLIFSNKNNDIMFYHTDNISLILSNLIYAYEVSYTYYSDYYYYYCFLEYVSRFSSSHDFYVYVQFKDLEGNWHDASKFSFYNEGENFYFSDDGKSFSLVLEDVIVPCDAVAFRLKFDFYFCHWFDKYQQDSPSGQIDRYTNLYLGYDNLLMDFDSTLYPDNNADTLEDCVPPPNPGIYDQDFTGIEVTTGHAYKNVTSETWTGDYAFEPIPFEHGLAYPFSQSLNVSLNTQYIRSMTKLRHKNGSKIFSAGDKISLDFRNLLNYVSGGLFYGTTGIDGTEFEFNYASLTSSTFTIRFRGVDGTYIDVEVPTVENDVSIFTGGKYKYGFDISEIEVPIDSNEIEIFVDTPFENSYFRTLEDGSIEMIDDFIHDLNSEFSYVMNFNTGFDNSSLAISSEKYGGQDVIIPPTPEPDTETDSEGSSDGGGGGTSFDKEEPVKSIFDSIIELPGKIIDGILDGLSSLFIPEGEFFEGYFGKLDTLFTEKLGFLYVPIDLLLSFMNAFLQTEPGVASIQFPEWQFMGYTIFESQEVVLNFDDLPGLQEAIYFVSDVVLTGAFINLLQMKYREVFR